MYGMEPLRPLRIVAWLWAEMTVVYLVLWTSSAGFSGLYLLRDVGDKEGSHQPGTRIAFRSVSTPTRWRYPLEWLRRNAGVFGAMLLFSSMSTFNFRFRGVDFGKWIRLLLPVEIDIKPVGWARTVSWFQTLLSAYLIALSVLSYFFRPFG
jgi:hypothetical protein